MADIKNLTDKITEDARVKAQEILKAAEEEASLKEAEIMKAAEDRKDLILKRAVTETELIRERVISAHALSVRDEKLKERVKVIERTLQLAGEALKDLPAPQFTEYMKKALSGRQIPEGTKLKVNPSYLEEVRKEFPSADAEADERVSGFELESGGIVENHSFDSLMDFMRDELEEIAARELFSKEG